MKFFVDKPYPEIKVKSKNIVLAKKIFSVYAGEVSEDTSSHNYSLQSILFSYNEEVKDILKQIAMVEMHHLEILGTLIKELGLTPLYLSVDNNKVKWFSGSYITAEKSLKDAIFKNINYEKQAIRNYQQLILETDDENIKKIFKRIILDEELHVEIFEKIYCQL